MTIVPLFCLQMVIPGDVAEMTEFQEKTTNNSRFILELCLPNVQLALPSKAFYEKLHNRYTQHIQFWQLSDQRCLYTRVPAKVLKVLKNLKYYLHWSQIFFATVRRREIINLKPINVKRLCILCGIDIYLPPACPSCVGHCTGVIT